MSPKSTFIRTTFVLSFIVFTQYPHSLLVTLFNCVHKVLTYIFHRYVPHTSSVWFEKGKFFYIFKSYECIHVDIIEIRPCVINIMLLHIAVYLRVSWKAFRSLYNQLLLFYCCFYKSTIIFSLSFIVFICISFCVRALKCVFVCDDWLSFLSFDWYHFFCCVFSQKILDSCIHP